VLRHIAHRAGTLAPRIKDEIFDELHGAHHGSSLFAVERWFGERARILRWLGYHLRCRRMASPTRDLIAWIEAGCGYRGVVLATSHERLHPRPGTEVSNAVAHAVGLVLASGEADDADQDVDDQTVVIDPWSRAIETALAMQHALELAHAECGYQALAFHWIGWS
jgi:hypothetical protein